MNRPLLSYSYEQPSSTMKAVTLCAIVGIFGVASAVPIQRNGCPEICPAVFNPVCGTDGIQTLTFDNDCQMMQYNCAKKQSFNFLRQGDCDTTPTGPLNIVPGALPIEIPLCEDIWEPVCGTDGKETKTFPSQCFMDVVNSVEQKAFHMIKSGVCKDEKPVRKTELDCGMCLTYYDPVCATEGEVTRKFSNRCEVQNVNCRESRHFVIGKTDTC